MAVGLTIAAQALDIDGAWKHNRSLRRLRSSVRSRGDNRLIPNLAGRRAYPVQRDEVVVDLELIVFGRNNSAGTPYANTLAGLDTNLAYLDDWVAGLMDGTTSTYAASLETPDGTTYTADVQVLNWNIAQEHGTVAVVGYDLRVPAGIWVASP